MWVGLGEYTTITLRSCNYGVCPPPPKTGVSIVTVAVLPHLSHTRPPTTHRHAAHGHAVSEVARRLGKGGQSALVPDVIHLLIRRVLPVRLSNRGCRIVRDAVQRTCSEEGGGRRRCQGGEERGIGGRRSGVSESDRVNSVNCWSPRAYGEVLVSGSQLAFGRAVMQRRVRACRLLHWHRRPWMSPGGSGRLGCWRSAPVGLLAATLFAAAPNLLRRSQPDSHRAARTTSSYT